MMKYGLLFGLMLTFLSGFTQEVDSLVVVKAVDSLVNVSRILTGKSDFESALSANEAAKKLALEKFGSGSVPYGRCCFNHGRVLYFKGDYPEAEKWYLKAKDIYENKLGKDHTDYAKSLNNLAILYKEIGKYENAKSLYSETISIREKKLGKAHPDYAGSLNNLAIVYYTLEDYEGAEPLFLEAKSIWGKSLGIEHPDYSMGLNNLASLYVKLGSYEKAEPLHLESLAIREKVFGKFHPDYASSLNNLAILYWNLGNYEKAEALYLETKAIEEQVIGIEHPDYALTLNNLAILYTDIGEYKKAETMLLEAKAVREKVFGKEHLDYATTLNTLAVLYMDMKNYNKAESLFSESLAIRKKNLGKMQPQYATSLYNLGSVYSLKGNHIKAEPLLLEAKNVWAEIFGKEHPDYARSLNNIGSVYQTMGEFSKAEAYFIEAEAIMKKVLGKAHPDYAYSLISLGNFYSSIDKLEKTESIYLEAKDIFEKALGREHPRYGNSLQKLAFLYLNLNKHVKAEQLFDELSIVNKKLILQAFLHLSERELSSYLASFKESQDNTLSFIQLTKGKNVATTNYNNALFYKGFLLNSISQIRHLTISDSINIEKFNSLKSYQRRLAIEYAKPTGVRTNVAELEEKANTLEKELVRKVAGYGDLVRQVEWQEVRDKLPANTAALEFVHFNYYNPKPTDSVLYAALLLLPNDTTPRFIPLFEERQLQPLLNRPGLRDEDIVKDLYGNSPELAQLLWAPLEPWLRDVKTVYYSPSGLLHRINPAALLDAGGESIASGRAWVRLGSTRELVTNQLADQSYAQSGTETPLAAIYGGIQYEMDSTAFAAINPADLQNGDATFRKDGNFRYIAAADRTVVADGTVATDGVRGTDGDWEALPATAKEAEEVNALLRKAGYQTELKKGLGASEEHLKKLGANGQTSPRILHLATHGFAYPDPKKELQKGFGDNEPTYKLQDDPMLRSGLLLAGSNFYWKNKRPMDGREDGVLVAYEVRDLNLRNTELAVLSACQTGLGDVVGSEGVYGLQRAFRIAGAKFLIVSLWQVPDAKTQELMNLFYQNYLLKKEPLRTAFNHAQEAMRRKDPNPFGWAGFVLVE